MLWEGLLQDCLPLLGNLLECLQLLDLPLESLSDLFDVSAGCMLGQGLLHRAVKCPMLWQLLHSHPVVGQLTQGLE